jgi:hypothetical protein
MDPVISRLGHRRQGRGAGDARGPCRFIDDHAILRDDAAALSFGSHGFDPRTGPRSREHGCDIGAEPPNTKTQNVAGKIGQHQMIRPQRHIRQIEILRRWHAPPIALAVPEWNSASSRRSRIAAGCSMSTKAIVACQVTGGC